MSIRVWQPEPIGTDCRSHLEARTYNYVPFCVYSPLQKRYRVGQWTCVYFLLGTCECSFNDGPCIQMHPTGTAGWALLEQQRGLTYKDFDYSALNFLASRAPVDRERILQTVAHHQLGCDERNRLRFIRFFCFPFSI